MTSALVLAEAAVKSFKAGDIDGAIATLRQVVEIEPDDIVARTVAAGLCVIGGHHAEAIGYLLDVPETVGVLLLRAKAWAGLGDFDQARACAARAVDLDSGPDARIALAALDVERGMRGAALPIRDDQQQAADSALCYELLRGGELDAGFKILAAAAARIENGPGAMMLSTVGRQVPRWNGQRVGTLVVILDQGFGDALQFSRWLPAVRAHCDRLIVVAYAELHGLLSEFETVAPGDMDRALVVADAQIPAMLLPAFLPLAYEPAGGYLSAEPLTLPAGFNVGVGWASNPINITAAARSATVADLAPLRSLPGVNFWSLMQRDHDRPDWIHPPPLPLSNFSATAQLVAALDLVITVDTSVAHLAGALGRPVWIALPQPACWRWQQHPTQSAWYRTARLFRQRTPGDFGEVFRQMGAELANTLAPWCVNRTVLTPAECARVLAMIAGREFHRGQIYGNTVDASHRACNEVRLDVTDPELLWRRL